MVHMGKKLHNIWFKKIGLTQLSSFLLPAIFQMHWPISGKLDRGLSDHIIVTISYQIPSCYYHCRSRAREAQSFSNFSATIRHEPRTALSTFCIGSNQKRARKITQGKRHGMLLEGHWGQSKEIRGCTLKRSREYCSNGDKAGKKRSKIIRGRFLQEIRHIHRPCYIILQITE